MSKQFITFAAIVSLMPTLTMANTHAGTGKFFVGLGLGGQKADYNLTILDGPSTFSNSGTGQNMVGALAAGYLHSLSNSFFLGGDVEASYDKADANVKLGQTNSGLAAQPIRAHVKNDYTIGTGIKAGFLHEKTSFYARLGLAASTLKINASNSSSGASARTISGKKTLLGLALGGGIEHMLNDQVALGVDVRSTVYSVKKLTAPNANPAALDSTHFSVKVKPNFCQAMLTLKYFIK